MADDRPGSHPPAAGRASSRPGFLRLPPVEGLGTGELHDGVVVEVTAPLAPGHGASFLACSRPAPGELVRGQRPPRPPGGDGLPAEPPARGRAGPELAAPRGPARRSRWPDAARWPGPPDLAVGVSSAPATPRRTVRKKVQWYLEAGCPLVWVVGPAAGARPRCTAPAPRPRALGEGGRPWTGRTSCPGFRLPLADLWDALGPPLRPAERFTLCWPENGAAGCAVGS